MLFLLIYIILCLLLYLFQERIIFYPERLSKTYEFQFENPYTEHFVEITEGTALNLLQFKTPLPKKGVILYLHGNSKSLKYWGMFSSFFSDSGYDFITFDYRGFGKSDGKIFSQQQMYDDAEVIYEWVKQHYPDSGIILIGYSIGSGIAAYLAQKFQPEILILEAPYFNLSHIMRKNYPVFPLFILKYKFPTSDFLAKCKMPVYIFHGDKDEQISIKNSFRLSRLLKNKDRLIVLENQFHNNLMLHPEYQKNMKEILETV